MTERNEGRPRIGTPRAAILILGVILLLAVAALVWWSSAAKHELTAEQNAVFDRAIARATQCGTPDVPCKSGNECPHDTVLKIVRRPGSAPVTGFSADAHICVIDPAARAGAPPPPRE